MRFFTPVLPFLVDFYRMFGEILEISLYLKVKLDGLPIPKGICN